MKGETARCFVAIELPEAARAAIERLVERGRALGARVRWVRPQAVHLTLKFFGDVARARLPALREALRGVVLDAPLDLRLSGAGRFPPRGRPRVFWVGLAGDLERLADLAERIDAAGAAVGLPREQRPFRAHVTLGRAKGSRGLDELARALAAWGSELDVPFAPPPCDFALIESELSPEGSRYTVLERVVFARD